MPRQVQGAAAAQALEREYNLRGSIGISLDEIVVPVSIPGDFSGRSPYASRATGGDWQESAAAGAATYSGVLITPARGTLLVVEALTIVNVAGVTHFTTIGLMRPVDVAAVTVVAGFPMARWNGRVRGTGFIDQLAARSSTWHHTNTTSLAIIGRSVTTTNTERAFQLPHGIVLDGNDPNGPISLAVQSLTLNIPESISFALSEYPAPHR